MTTFPSGFFQALPKAELHVHLEGTVDAQTLLDLAHRHGVTPPAASAAEIATWYQFSDFEQFLERYFLIVDVLREPEDFALIADRYMRAAHAEGVVHVEFHVSATGHIVESGQRWVDVQGGVVEGCTAGERATGVSWGLIPDISPHLDARDSYRALEEVLSNADDHVVAVGMGGPARPHWWDKDFARFYDLVRASGLHAVAHAGEHGGPEEVRFAIEEFGAERIQHGIGAMGDSSVVQMLVERQIACDVCPGSNLALNAVATATEHPLCAMIAAGITVTLGSDDPPLFHTTLTDEYRRAWEWCQLDDVGLISLARNSIEASFASPTHKGEWINRLTS